MQGDQNLNGGETGEHNIYDNQEEENQVKKSVYHNHHHGRNHNTGYKGNYRKNFKNQYYPKIDSTTVQYMIYQAEMYILTRYPHLIDLNNKNEGILNNLNEKDRFIIIKSYTEEDVHKAIKYNVWTSTKKGNFNLNEAFHSCDGNIYLLFGCNDSSRFLGLCRMKSEIMHKDFPFWTQDDKSGELFDVEWIFIKDVPYKEFSKIIVPVKEGVNKPVSFLRDTQEVPYSEGKEMFAIFKDYVNTNTILEHFEYYDIRQDNYEKACLSMQNTTNIYNMPNILK